MLLEREELLAFLYRCRDEADGGTGALVLIAGEAGSGKTALVRHFVDSLKDSTLVIQGACDPLTTPRPFGPLYDFAADPNSDLAELVTQGHESIAMFDLVAQRLSTTIRPIVMIVEDIHWADEGTLDFIRFIGRRVAATKAVVICTYRDDEVGPDHPLRRLLGQLIPIESTKRFGIPALSLTAVTTLTGDQRLDPVDLFRLTDGNAFFVTEVLASGQSLPETVQDAVLARVAQLLEGPRRVVEGVSVAPRSLEIEQASALVQGKLEDIDAALAAGVLLSDARTLRFRHEIARSAVEQSLPPARRLGLHRRMLGLLDEEPTPDIARIAHHAVQADDVVRTLRYSPQAGRDAAARGAHKEAVAFFAAALAHAEQMERPIEADIRLALASELNIVDRQIESVDEYKKAVDLLRGSNDPPKLGRALSQTSRALWRINDENASTQAEIEALAILEPLGPSRELVEAYYTASYRHMLARHGTAASAEIDKALSTAELADDSDLLWNIKMMQGCIRIVFGDSDIGIQLLAESRDSAKSEGNHRNLNVALGMLGSAGGEARVYEVAVDALNESIEYGIATDGDYEVAYSRSWLARIAFEQGRWDNAVRYAELVDNTSADRTGIAVLTALSALGRIRVRRGDPGGVSLLENMLEIGATMELQHSWNAICGYAEHNWLTGSPEASLRVLAPAYERALDTDSEWARGEIGFWMWKARAIDGPPDGAARPFALHMSEKWELASEAWREIGCPYEVAMALADGDERAMIEAVSIFASLGARPAADMVRMKLRQMGAESIPRGPSAATKANPAGLTARQLEVLNLMSQGLSNGEIAKALYVTKKTIEHHISAIYSKLSVDNRAKALDTYAEFS